MRRRRFRVVVVSLAALFLRAVCIEAQTAAPSGKSEAAAAALAHGQAGNLAFAGLPNSGRVSPTLYRGGQPGSAGYEELKKLGIEIVVNFRNEPEKIEVERRAVEVLGLRYVSLPLSSWHRPDTKLVAEFFDLVRANPERKIFVHCHRGADRTGVMVAAYRIAFDHWTPPQALEEMSAYHFHSFWFRHLKRYVQNFPQLLAADPALRQLAPAAQGAGHAQAARRSTNHRRFGPSSRRAPQHRG